MVGLFVSGYHVDDVIVDLCLFATMIGFVCPFYEFLCRCGTSGDILVMCSMLGACVVVVLSFVSLSCNPCISVIVGTRLGST
jgi:hypothetical protein